MPVSPSGIYMLHLFVIGEQNSFTTCPSTCYLEERGVCVCVKDHPGQSVVPTLCLLQMESVFNCENE